MVGDIGSRHVNFLLTPVIAGNLQLELMPLHFSAESLPEAKQQRVVSKAFHRCYQNPSLHLDTPHFTSPTLSDPISTATNLKADFRKVLGNSKCSTTIN